RGHPGPRPGLAGKCRHACRLDGKPALRAAGRGAGQDRCRQSVKALFSGEGGERRHALRSVAIFLAVSLTFGGFSLLFVNNFSVLSRLDQFVQDWEVASVFAPREAQDPDIVIVAIDEATLSNFAYRSPVDRQFLSTLLTQLAAHQPKA